MSLNQLSYYKAFCNIFCAKLGAFAMLLRMKTVGQLKSATCPISSCAKCVLISGRRCSYGAAMEASAPEKSGTTDKAPSNSIIPVLFSRAPRSPPSRPATCNQRPRIRLQYFREELIATWIASAAAAHLLSSPYVSRGSDAVSSCTLRAQ
jgi:hypothetical protein